ncbi:MAG: TonB-dependent receptor plug domain-containing protein, partial [Chlorobiales bacterium]|nr:TonB-dependent receptor plug domain-containing protein [Chlorobiales bacterium]
MSLFRKTFSILCLLSVSSPIFAQENPAETEKTYQAPEVVVTATLSEKPVSDIPASIEVFSDAEIKDMGSRMLPDVLYEAQSTTLEPTNGRLSVAKLRGLSSKNTLILIDGVRQPSGFQDYVDLSEIPVGMIERIEVVRGSSSALYGSDAIGGVINVITKKPTETFRANLNARYGQSTYEDAENPLFNAYATGSLGSFGYAVSGTFNSKNRYDRDKSDLMTDGDDKTIQSGSGKLTYQINPLINLTFGLSYSDIELEGVRTQTTGDFDRTVNSDRLSGYFEFATGIGELSKIVARAQRSYYEWSSD